jgi:hypothetical protein
MNWTSAPSDVECSEADLGGHASDSLLGREEEGPELRHERRGAVLVHEPGQVDLHLARVGHLVSD